LVDFTRVLLWSWLARGRFTPLGLALVAVGLLIPILALTYVHLAGTAVAPTAQAASAASDFIEAVQRQDVVAEQRLLSPDATADTRQFASVPFIIRSFAKRGSDVFWGFQYAVVGHPGVGELRLLISCRDSGCSVRQVILQP
jgi:hypothetical protein